ncbi:hypothetical protein J5X84_34315 [Streptosporangiaceae bacterium NEAU-GS5]|nr:hypothetical protein [Streptosporangiaceae bacterium NEAU-GS5]
MSPAWDQHDYDLKAGATAETVAANLEMARLVVAHPHTAAYDKTVLTDVVDTLSSVNAQFGGIQPPVEPAGDLTDMTRQAEDMVQDLLFDQRGPGIDDRAKAAAGLEDLAKRLRAYAEAHQ